jgi:hypothetical protein
LLLDFAKAKIEGLRRLQNLPAKIVRLVSPAGVELLMQRCVLLLQSRQPRLHAGDGRLVIPVLQP